MGLFGEPLLCLPQERIVFNVIPLFENLVHLLLTKEILILGGREEGRAEFKCDETYDSFHYDNDHIEIL